MSFKYPLASFTWDQNEYAALQRVIDSNMFTMGEKVAQFERDFSIFTGSRYSVMVNSGSSANLAMIAALFYVQIGPYKLSRGDEVIVPAVSWSTTYSPLYQYGLKMKFVDIDLQTLNMDVNAVKNSIGPKTKAILAVNLLGNPCELEILRAIAQENNLILLEDNCESLGATLNGKQCGTFGLMGTYSSFFSHHISTMEGGVICTDDEELYQILLCIRAHGWTRNLPEENMIAGRKSIDPFEESFKFVLPGYNIRPIEMAGALGIEQVKKLPSLIHERQKNGQLWQEKMVENPNILIQKEVGSSSWFGFSMVIRSESKLKRPELIKKLNHHGFECRPIVAGNFAKNPVVKRYFDYEIYGSLENASHIDSHGLFIGNQHYPISDAIEFISTLEM